MMGRLGAWARGVRPRTWVLGVAATLLVTTAVFAAGFILRVAGAERVDFDPDRGRAALPGATEGAGSPDGSSSHGDDAGVGAEDPPDDAAIDPEGLDPSQDTVPPLTAPQRPIEGTFETFLMLGSDTRQDMGGERADVILLGLVPSDDSDPILFSLPRDLWVANPCTEGMSRINAGLNGCGSEVSGPELMAIMVEDLTTIPVDHYARVDFDGFEEVVDALGGVRICNDHAVRETGWDREWSLPAGCVDASGSDTLGWVRSRRTQERVDGVWRTQRGVNDLVRNERQQEVLLQAVEGLTSFRSPGQLHALGRGIAGSVTLSDSLSMTRMARLGWSLRGIDRSNIRRFSLPVRSHVTSGGAQVLLLEEPIPDTFARATDDDVDLRAER